MTPATLVRGVPLDADVADIAMPMSVGGIIPWVGVRRVAVVPVLDRTMDVPPPDDWVERVRARTFFDPDPVTGFDRSFQNYLRTVSSGVAILDGEVFPTVWSEDAEVNLPAMNSLPPGHGYDVMVAVLPHSFGQHRGGWAWWDLAPVNGITAWARVAMFDDLPLSARQPIGIWAMEIIHAVTHFPDLYRVQPNLGEYDVMASAGAGTHPSAHTKELLGWLPHGRIVEPDEGVASVRLHAIGLPHPPPRGRATAVRIPARGRSSHFMVEARRPVDMFDRPGAPGGRARPPEGVLVYEVERYDRVFYRATVAPGTRYVNDAERWWMDVNDTIPGGYAVSIRSNPDPFVSGRLLFYRDETRDGTGDVRDPWVIGLGGWQQFRHLFSGGNGTIYAVDQQGRLLFYRDSTQDGTGDVSSPSVIGQGGWQQFRHLFPGGDGIIYAVDQAGRLLFYRDAAQDGTNDLSNPSVIGQGGWQQFRLLFSGGEGLIYGVDQAGRLRFARDHNRDGTGDVAISSFIGAGWGDRRFAFAGGPSPAGVEPGTGGNRILYSVDGQGRLLHQLHTLLLDDPGNDSHALTQPAVIGLGGWQQFRFLFPGSDGIIYAVPQ